MALNIPMSHGIRFRYMNESFLTKHIRIGSTIDGVEGVNESCHTHESLTSHIQIENVTHSYKGCSRWLRQEIQAVTPAEGTVL